MINKKNKKVKLVVSDTERYGQGVFAGESIKTGRVIHVLCGDRMDVMELVRRVNANKERINDPFQIGKRTYLDLDRVSNSFNHSCDPNTGIRKNSEMFALKDIEEGQQLTYDYSSIISPTEWKMKCKCGSNNCRKILGDILSLPKKQLNYYKKVGALQRYMRSLLREIESGRYKIPKYELLALETLKQTSED